MGVREPVRGLMVRSGVNIPRTGRTCAVFGNFRKPVTPKSVTDENLAPRVAPHLKEEAQALILTEMRDELFEGFQAKHPTIKLSRAKFYEILPWELKEAALYDGNGSPDCASVCAARDAHAISIAVEWYDRTEDDSDGLTFSKWQDTQGDASMPNIVNSTELRAASSTLFD